MADRPGARFNQFAQNFSKKYSHHFGFHLLSSPVNRRMPRQVLELLDYFAPLAALVMVWLLIFIYLLVYWIILLSPLPVCFGHAALCFLPHQFLLHHRTWRFDSIREGGKGWESFSFATWDSDSLEHRTIFALARTQWVTFTEVAPGFSRSKSTREVRCNSNWRPGHHRDQQRWQRKSKPRSF